MLSKQGGFNYRRVRGVLAENMVSQRELAGASRLSWQLVNAMLNGRETPGELARYKLREGLQQLGIDPAVAFGPAEEPARSADE